MAEPKWRKGLWYVGADLGFEYGVAADDQIIMYANENAFEDDEQMLATLFLASAAPDLYRELENLVELAEVAMRAANRDGGEYDIEAELAGARAALRKARGEQQ